MYNFMLGIICTILCFSLEVIIEKKFKKEGLIVWVSVAMVTANILVTKNVDILNLSSTLGNILFASTFLATDILSEKYSFKDSRKAVNLGMVSVILFTIATQISLVFKANELDLVDNSLRALFTFNLRVSTASMIMCYLSNTLDIIIYEKIKAKKPNKLWLRNNVSTILSNCLENYAFTILAFANIYKFSDILVIATTTTIIEILIAICDTPFLYLSKKLK